MTSLRADAPVRATFTVEAGVFMRGRIRRAIESEAWRRGLELEIRESKGFLESLYHFVVRGPGNKVTKFVRDVDEWAKEIGDD